MGLSGAGESFFSELLLRSSPESDSKQSGHSPVLWSHFKASSGVGSRANHTFLGVKTQPKRNHKGNHKRAGRALKAGPSELESGRKRASEDPDLLHTEGCTWVTTSSRGFPVQASTPRSTPGQLRLLAGDQRPSFAIHLQPPASCVCVGGGKQHVDLLPSMGEGSACWGLFTKAAGAGLGHYPQSVSFKVCAQLLCRVQLFATPWTVALQAPISYSRGSSQPRDWTRDSCVSCTGRWILYHLRHLGSPISFNNGPILESPG